MFRRAKSVTKSKKQSRTESRRNGRKTTAEVTQKGRGKRARKTIRELPQSKTNGSKQSKTKDAGPPLKIPREPARKQVTREAISPSEVVRNNRRRKRCSGRRALSSGRQRSRGR